MLDLMLDLGESNSQVPFHPLTFGHRVNNFNAQNINSPAGPQPNKE